MSINLSRVLSHSCPSFLIVSVMLTLSLPTNAQLVNLDLYRPSTGLDTYTVADWLAPRSNAPDQIAVLQLVSPTPNDDWTDDFLTCVTWLRTQNRRTIYPGSTA